MEAAARLAPAFGGYLSEIASVVRWLASDEGSYISGAAIPVDGGASMDH